MAHGGISKSFWGMLKETSVAFFFDIGGLFAGFIVASQLGVFRLTPWAIAIYPAIIGAKSVIEGILSGRLSTALHLGTVYPRFSANTKSFYKLIEALIVVNLATAAAMSAFALFFGHFFWEITISDFSAILSVVVATMALGLTFFVVTVKVAFVSFKRGLDPDIVVYPVMSSVAGILITVFYVVALNLFFLFGSLGQWVLIILGLIHLFIVGYILPRNLREQEFIKTLRETFAMIVIVSFIVNITGTILRRISHYATNYRVLYTIYPALINMISDVGSVVGSTATTKLALGLLTPSLSSIRHHAKNIFSAWAASIMMFIVLAASALAIHGLFSLSAFSSLLSVLLVANIIAVVTIIILSYAISILTFKKGLDPGNFVIPIESSFSASVISIALLMALLLLR
jgi:mgtE-like transporter